MSKETYLAGFRKAAEARKVDPEALARFVMAKAAEDDTPGDVVDANGVNHDYPADPGIWEKVKAYCDAAAGKTKDVWNELGPSTQSVVGALAGAGIGTGIGAAVSKKDKRKKGLSRGAILGAIAGATAPHLPYEDIVNSFANKSWVEDRKKRSGNA